MPFGCCLAAPGIYLCFSQQVSPQCSVNVFRGISGSVLKLSSLTVVTVEYV